MLAFDWVKMKFQPLYYLTLAPSELWKAIVYFLEEAMVYRVKYFGKILLDHVNYTIFHCKTLKSPRISLQVALPKLYH